MPATRSGLLLDERVVTAHPSLVRALGLTQAVVLQQINWHLVAAEHGIDRDGYEWFPVTREVLSSETGLTAAVVRHATDALERSGILVSCQPEGRTSRRKWYRINRTHAAIVQVSDSSNGNCRTAHFPFDGSVTSSSSKQEEILKEPTRHSEKRGIYDAQFELWWSLYPRKTNKIDARKAYTRARQRGAKSDQLCQARDHYTATCKRDGTDEKFIRHAATFLNEDRWQEYATTPEPARNGRRGVDWDRISEHR